MVSESRLLLDLNFLSVNIKKTKFNKTLEARKTTTIKRILLVRNMVAAIAAEIIICEIV